MEVINNCSNPIIGEYYLVKCVLVGPLWRPVVDDSHSDNPKHALKEEHYHQDWRFVPEEYILAQREVYKGAGYDNLPINNREYFAPIMKWKVDGEDYKPLEYLRDWERFEYQFGSLRKDMKNAKMRNFICPHHKTNLRSCKAVNGVIQCPQHGLRWNIKTGKKCV